MQNQNNQHDERTTTMFMMTSTKNEECPSDMKSSQDHAAYNVWVLEPPPFGAGGTGPVLSEQGLDKISHHTYRPGSYTALDSLLNPLWQYLTDCLPLWLAPNAVTALGGFFCLVSYLLTAHYNFTLTQEPAPNVVLIVNGLCLIAYYTLDCMDGKQARRTKSSSPLGQLFDHGVDCMCNLSHLSLMQSIVQWPVRHYLWIQVSLQLGFFQAQWEEYYTGILQHATGNIGVTEVLYGMATWSILSGLGILDRDVYSQQLPSWAHEFVRTSVRGASFILDGSVVSERSVDKSTMEVRDVMILFWVYGYMVLAIFSMIRVVSHLREGNKPAVTMLSAMSKLISPLILCASAVYLVIPYSDTDLLHATQSDLPVLNCFGGIRYPSLCVGLAFCSITIKLIVFGMARMPYASLQLDVLLFPVMVVLYRRLQWQDISMGHPSGASLMSSSPMILPGHEDIKVLDLLFPLATFAYGLRLVWWTRSAIDQLSQKLQIRLFRIEGGRNEGRPIDAEVKRN